MGRETFIREEGPDMFCSTCGAEVRDTDSFCWKCGAKVGEPSAKVASIGASECSPKVPRKTIFVGEDGTIHVKSPKVAAKSAGASTPAPLATCIDPSSYAGTWLDVHRAVLATGSEFDCLTSNEGDGTLDYSLNPEALPFIPENDPGNCFVIGVSGLGNAPVVTPEDIPQSLKADWIQLFLSKVDTDVDTDTLVWMVRTAADFVGFTPHEIQEGGEGNHELTDAVVASFGISGKTISGEDAVRYYDKRKDKRNGFRFQRDKFRLFGHVGHPIAMYEAEMSVGSTGGINLVTP